MVVVSADRAISPAEASAEGRLVGLIEEVAASGAGVIVEAEGKPAAVTVPLADYEELVGYRKAKRREEAAARLRALRQEVLARNRDLSPEEADEIADRFSHEIIEDMAVDGKIRFERDGIRG